jgi:hypothetical protein
VEEGLLRGEREGLGFEEGGYEVFIVEEWFVTFFFEVTYISCRWEVRFVEGGSWSWEDWSHDNGMSLKSDIGGREVIYSLHHDFSGLSNSRRRKIVNC